MVNALSFFLLFFSLASCLLLLVYPMALLAASLFVRREREQERESVLPSVSLLCVARNAAALIEGKIQNFLSLEYPIARSELVIYSDGSTDDTVAKAEASGSRRVRVFASDAHIGKVEGINNAMEHCHGDLVVFTDVDAMLQSDALLKIVRHFMVPDVGGVCGQRVVVKESLQLEEAQKLYVSVDSAVKKAESKLQSITSNDGKLYAIRRELFSRIESGVMDDLYVCLSIVKKGKRFTFEPDAKATIRVPSRSYVHELVRRKRIVVGSLTAIWLNRELLNPRRYGFYAVGLFINKVVRRLVPVLMIFILVSTTILVLGGGLPFFLLGGQVAFYAVPILYLTVLKDFPPRGPLGIIRRVGSSVTYFCLGNLGVLLALLSLVSGPRVTKWEPFKGG